jgi:nitroreductase
VLDRMLLMSELLATARSSGSPERPCGAISAATREAGRVAATGQAVSLPGQLGDRLPLAEVLQRRRSIRFYSQGELRADELGTLLAASCAADRASWPREVAAGVELQLLVVALDVGGVDAGLYRYGEDGHELAPVASLDGERDLGNLFLQVEFACAPAVVLVAGSLAAAVERHGDHGHRLLLARAGEAAHNVWLAAVSLGLAGTVFAGVLPHALQRLAEVDGYWRTPLFACAVGRAAATTQPRDVPPTGQ